MCEVVVVAVLISGLTSRPTPHRVENRISSRLVWVLAPVLFSLRLTITCAQAFLITSEIAESFCILIELVFSQATENTIREHGKRKLHDLMYAKSKKVNIESKTGVTGVWEGVDQCKKLSLCRTYASRG